MPVLHDSTKSETRSVNKDLSYYTGGSRSGSGLRSNSGHRSGSNLRVQSKMASYTPKRPEVNLQN